MCTSTIMAVAQIMLEQQHCLTHNLGTSACGEPHVAVCNREKLLSRDKAPAQILLDAPALPSFSVNHFHCFANMHCDGTGNACPQGTRPLLRYCWRPQHYPAPGWVTSWLRWLGRRVSGPPLPSALPEMSSCIALPIGRPRSPVEVL